eukprot:COSAG06_NODE_747_length_12638_cov_3.671957_9_plen_452_part_00
MGPRRSALLFLLGLGGMGWLAMSMPARHDAAHPHHMNAMEDVEDVVGATTPDCLDPVLFAGHDPSSKNHARPVFEAFKAAGSGGHCALWFDLASPHQKAAIAAHPTDWGARLLDGLGSSTKPLLLFTGNSVAPIEYNLITAAKARGIRTVTLVEFGPGNLRSTRAVTPKEWPHSFLVTNEATQKELAKMTHAKPEDVKLVGSSHFEKLVQSGEGLRRQRGSFQGRFDASAPPCSQACEPPARATVRRVAYFSGNPELADHVEILQALLRLLSDWMVAHAADDPSVFRVVVRVHPRTSAAVVAELDQACASAFAGFAGAWAKMEMPPLASSALVNQELLVASDFALSMSSTVSLESVCVGTPASFMLVGHTTSHRKEAEEHLDSVFGVLPAVPRIVADEDMSKFIDSALSQSEQALADMASARASLEANAGALARTLQVVEELLPQSNAAGG